MDICVENAQHPWLLEKCKSKLPWDTTSHQSEWPLLISPQIANIEKGLWKGNPPTLLVGMYIGTATMENSMEVPHKTKYRTTIWSRNPPPGQISRQNFPWKRYMHLLCSLQHYSQQPKHGNNLNIHQQTNGLRRCSIYTQWNTTQPYKWTK